MLPGHDVAGALGGGGLVAPRPSDRSLARQPAVLLGASRHLAPTRTDHTAAGTNDIDRFQK
jgi:hypothetical protein